MPAEARAILIGGNSRGGILSIAYAAKHPKQFLCVINFVGGWVGDVIMSIGQTRRFSYEARVTADAHFGSMERKNDMYYSIAHSRSNFETCSRAGGNDALSNSMTAFWTVTTSPQIPRFGSRRSPSTWILC